MNDFDDLSDDDYGFDDDFSSASDAGHDSDEFDQLRRSSARSETMLNELDDENRPTAGGSSFSLSNFTAGQRLVLALLVVLDIIVIGILFVVLWGIISG